MARRLPPVYPGEILREEFLVPLKLTPYAAPALHVPRTRIERIAREEKPVTADTTLRLGKFFKTGAAFWMNIQARYDLETAEDVLRAADQEDCGLQSGVRAMLSADKNCGALDRAGTFSALSPQLVVSKLPKRSSLPSTPTGFAAANLPRRVLWNGALLIFMVPGASDGAQGLLHFDVDFTHFSQG